MAKLSAHGDELYRLRRTTARGYITEYVIMHDRVILWKHGWLENGKRRWSTGWKRFGRVPATTPLPSEFVRDVLRRYPEYELVSGTLPKRMPGEAII